MWWKQPPVLLWSQKFELRRATSFKSALSCQMVRFCFSHSLTNFFFERFAGWDVVHLLLIWVSFPSPSVRGGGGVYSICLAEFQLYFFFLRRTASQNQGQRTNAFRGGSRKQKLRLLHYKHASPWRRIKGNIKVRFWPHWQLHARRRDHCVWVGRTFARRVKKKIIC